jgi:hypothetical protein
MNKNKLKVIQCQSFNQKDYQEEKMNQCDKKKKKYLRKLSKM